MLANVGLSLRSNIQALSFGVDGNALPSEFRLFVPGWNDTENGKFLFDSAAAESVMAAYQKWGVDLAIDLEHQMLDPLPSADPTARDARGWCRLELRSDGSLWAVGVRWTPDGAARLSEKRQRYVSPAFETDEQGRVTKIVNVAITAIPATHQTPALVAASLRSNMTPDDVKKALDAIEAGDQAAALEILKNMLASAAASEEAPAAEAPEEPAAEMSAAPPPPAAEEEDPAKKAEQVASLVAASRIKTLSGRDSVEEALEEVAAWRASHIALEAEREKIAREKAALEAAERRSICVDLIKCGAEFPSTVWADDKASSLKSRWVSMPIAELRAHAADQKLARSGKQSFPAAKPAATENDGSKVFETKHGPVTLSARELANCKEAGADPEVYALNKAIHTAAARRNS